MLDKLLFVLTQKLALVFVAGLSVAGGLLTMGSTHGVVVPSQTAIISNAVAGSTANAMAALPPSSSSTSMIVAAVDLPDIPLGMLPTTTIPFCPANATSTCSQKNIKALIRLSASIATPVAPAPQIAAITPVVIKKTIPTPSTAPTSSAVALQTITAQSFLDDTTSSLKILLNGSDEVAFVTNLPNQAPITWGLLSTTISAGSEAGSTSTVQFSVTSPCDPAPQLADPGALDKNPTFNVRTTYNCSVSLTPMSGTNRVTQSKDFSFTTPPGELVAMNDSAMTTLLANNTNNGGIVFNNQDTHPVTITGVTFDASYSYLTLLNGPLVLRFLNPATEQSLVDYHMENLPADPSATNNYTQSGITLPLSFTIPPLTQKLLPMQILGVDRMLMSGTSPTVKIVLRSVTTDQSDVKAIMNNPNVTWNCSVSTSGYDPNATSGVYATGQACLN